MARINPFALKRPALRVTERTYSDPLQPDVPPQVIRLRAFDPPGFFARMERVEEQVKVWVDPPGEGLEPNAFPGPDNVPIRLSRSMVEMAVTLAMAECGPEDDRYGFEGWVQLSVVMPSLFYDVAADMTLLTRFPYEGMDLPPNGKLPEDDDLPNPLQAATETSSEPSADITPATPS